MRAVSEVSINRSLDTLDPKTLLDPKMLLSSPQYRSRNESYMRAMSTISQVCRTPPFPLKGYISCDVTIFETQNITGPPDKRDQYGHNQNNLSV